ncbi:ABC transporter substrate-binding protein [Yangia mangrovi]|nr:ABC transporter substrate-binding protein [Alloyangia mangrovi]MCT4368903.1 ABC transporter substrate-binding protein [Alloyangia mangrovi]
MRRPVWPTMSSAAALLALGLSFTAPLAPASAAEPARGGEMTIINGSDIKGWDPAVTNSTYPGGPMDVLDAIYGFIVYVDVNGVVQGGMAKSLTSDDAVTWTLKLRDGLTFTDGTPYDAEAVKYNWERAADPDTLASAGTWAATWAGGMEVVDPLTLKITLPAPNAIFAQQVAELVPFIASPKMLEAAGTDKTKLQPVGAGAFTLESWDQGIGMTLARNPDYWDAPRPYLDTLKFKIIPETNSRISTVVQGGATMMAGYTYQFGNNAEAPGVATKEIPIRGIYRGYFNFENGIFQDLRAREAFYAAIDRGRLMQAYTQTKGYTAPDNYFGESSAYFAPDYKVPGYDPEKAQELIDELAADGKPFEVNIVTYPNSDMKRLAEYVQQVINAYDNASAKITEVAMANLRDTCNQQLAYDVCFDGGALVSNGAEPNISKLLGTGGALNWSHYSSPEMDKLLAAATETVDEAEIKADYAEAQKLFAEDLPFYIFGEDHRHLLLRDDTGGVVNSNGGILQKQYLFVCDAACVE